MNRGQKEQNDLTIVNWKNWKPCRSPQVLWERSGERAIVCIRQSGLVATIGRWFTGRETWKRIELDTIGTFVWERCDGQHTASEIAADLTRKYGLHRREAEASLLEFLVQLKKRGLVQVREGE
ncbi:MAG: PqqD family protein [Armatimonadetes bacterium]|nr:PqqD family protein [Armatimonadota bacterium]MDW8122572.1 PqqD family protein [Armatimonadota bacterium]